MSKIIIASGPVIVENDKVLLTQHGDTDFWKFCGGKVEDSDQRLTATAMREAKEEMGFEIEITNPDPFVMYTLKQIDHGFIDVLLVHYQAKRLGEVNPGADIRQWHWFTQEELTKEELAPNILPTLKHFGFIK
ncbi:MAG: NUDIX hydrolase [bacterium]